MQGYHRIIALMVCACCHAAGSSPSTTGVAEYTRIRTQVRVIDSKGVEHVLGPGFFYPDVEHQKLATRAMEQERRAQEQELRARYAEQSLMIIKQRDAELQVLAQERQALESRSRELQDKEIRIWEQKLEVERRATAIERRENRSLRRRNLVHKLGAVAAFAIGMKVGGL